MEIKQSVINRFNSLFFETDECINYPILNKEGYGEMQTYLEGKKKHYLMHRVAFQVINNINLEPENIVCHKCDNPACINTRHLFKCTHEDNVADRVKKGRSASGINNGRYKHGLHVK